MIIYYKGAVSTAPAIEYGVQILEEALREKAVPVYKEWLSHRRNDNKMPYLTIISKNARGKSPEAYDIQRNGNETLLLGYGAVGAMYGLFDLAETVRCKGWDSVCEGEWSPFLEKRGVKFNLPFQVYSNGDPFIKNEETAFSFEFWRDYIDFLARNRYNCLSLWTENPFEMLLDLTKYPEASSVSPENRKKYRNLYTKILRHAKNRGMETYFITWNLRISPEIAKGLGLPEELGEQDWDNRSMGLRQHQEVIKDYFRESVKTLILTFPELTGLGTSNSEELVGSAEEREQWVVDTYLAAIKELGYPIPFIHRTNMSNGSIAQDMFFSQYPGKKTYVSWKYSNAHMYSHPHPQFEKTFDAWGGQDMSKINVLYTVRNDDFHNLRGCDPVFLAEYFKGMKKPWVKGFYWGADCYLWGKEFQHTPNSHVQWEYSFQKHWMQFAMIGRLSYNPELSEKVWLEQFGRLYGNVTGAAVFRGLVSGVRILSAVNRLFWHDYDFQWYPESLLSSTGFKTILDVMNGEAMPGVGTVSIKNYLAAKHEGKNPEGETPVQILSLIEDQLKEIESSINAASENPEAHAGELECVCMDIKAWQALGSYYLCKFKAAMELAEYQNSRTSTCREKAVLLLEEALEHWRRLAEIGSRHYLPYHMPRVNHIIGWSYYIGDVEHDIYLAKNL